MKHLFSFSLLLAATLSFAQQRQAHLGTEMPAQRTCATVEYNRQQSQDPRWARGYERARQMAGAALNNAQRSPGVVITIPVVVHVVYANANQNVSDAQINSQIAILNQDFRKLNPDVSLTPAPFAPLAADAQIEFCLAQRDPQGNATNGITRTSTTHGAFYLENDVKFNSTGGKDAWNTDAYLNLWVCNLSAGLLGYAQFPGGDPFTDGVVVNYTAFGNTGTATAPYNKGRTATHEVGHYFDLIHIWGDEPACAQDDDVADTPQQKNQNGGCPTYPLISGSGASCSGTAPGAMFMNYMDYTNDACMYMFTQGQATRMNAALTQSRTSLMSSLGCLPPSVSCGTPQGLQTTNVTSSTAFVSWSAVPSAQSYVVEYKLASAANWTTANSPGSSITLVGLQASSNYQWRVKAVCAGGAGPVGTIQSFTTGVPTVQTCDTLSNWTAAATPALYTCFSTANNTWGYVAGHNSYGDIAKVEKFTGFSSQNPISGAMVRFGRANANSPASQFQLKIWNQSGTMPGSVIGSTNVNYTTVQPSLNTGWVYLPFGSQIVVPSTFFLGIQFAPNGTDTIALYSNTNGQTNPGTAYEQFSDNTWHAFTETPASWGINISLAIRPVLCNIPTGIAAEQALDALDVFPNPGSDVVSINLQATDMRVQAEWFNALGQRVEPHGVLNGSLRSFDFAGQPEGLYYLKLRAGDRNVVRKWMRVK